MDSFDHKILRLLSENARQSISSIAEQVNLSRSAVTERIKRLEESGEIQGYQVILRRPTSQPIQVWFEVRHHGVCESLVQDIMPLRGVRECYGISGDLDLLIKAEAASMLEIEQLRQAIDNFPHIKQVITHVVLREWQAPALEINQRSNKNNTE